MPATKEDIETDRILFFRKFSGTISNVILVASASTIAVFPTPASPINKGLFLHLLDKISITRLISSSLPITGSKSPFKLC